MPKHPTIDEVMRRRSTITRRVTNETYAALALVAATAIALLWANIGNSYDTVWLTTAGFRIGDLSLEMSLGDWVSEGLMAFFFFSVGLDVRREITLGELRDPRRALLPVVAAIGGLIVPALVFLILTHGQDYASAWGAVISTDTAFAIGMLALIGPRNAPRLRVFLLTLAVVDDIGALSVIAGFYTHHLDVMALAVAAVGLVGVWLLARRKVWQITPYALLGVGIWVSLYQSGVHATLAGVLVALLMPVYPQRRRDIEYASVFFKFLRQAPSTEVARTARDSVLYAFPLNQRLAGMLPPWINYLVVPVFALANAGVAFSSESLATAFSSSLTWGVIVGLVGGKLVGIVLCAAIVTRLVPASRLPGLDLPRITGVAALSGMGFTISLLVVGIAIEDRAAQDAARVGVLTASVLALLIAWVIFQLGDRFAPLPTPADQVLQRAVNTGRDHVRGLSDATADLVVYAAMDDEYRRHTAESLTEVRRRLGDDLRITFRHHTTTDETLYSALVLEAAAAQGGFWKVHDAMVHSREPLDEDAILACARNAGLDAEAIAERVRRGSDRTRVEDDNLDAATAELPAAPVLFAHGRRVTSPPTSWHLVQILTAELG